ncbi:SDR family NAD(P)-dependent oxidoreductase [Sulfuriferula thiophila]|uniref:SDR family NAD(P)-dependent oxidoreductase n=1 Tax=Sulfuriferula thiophila TaxID=1781211 RepID=UPI000F60A6FC|nr:3-oxoacyl-ACP reductase family protein [Sulfuriferula thiophila]
MNITLHNKTAIVTGAATGIGRAIAFMLGQAGAFVIVNHLNRAKEAEQVVHSIIAQGGNAIAIEADVTNAHQVRQMMASHEQIDILVNNAGVIAETPFLNISESEWDHVLNSDLKSVFLCSQAVLPGMAKRGDGIIVNISSDLAYLGREHYASYCAAKAGVIGLTRSLAREFAPAIRVNAVAPGPVNTAMVSIETMSPEWIEKEKDIPYRRFAEPEEIAATVLFLVSDYAKFYCGQVLGPNGGSVMP